MDKVKFDYDDLVSFDIDGKTKTGKVYIIDRFGTFEQNEEPSYDIMVESENCLYKHIRQRFLRKAEI